MKNGDSENEVLRIESKLDNLINILERAHPAPGTSWYHSIYNKAQAIVKYVGIPSLFLASIIPVYNLGKSYIDYSNLQHIQKITAIYASDLIQNGHIERSKNIISRLEELQSLPPVLHYVSAKAMAATAISQGKNHNEAEDALQLLLRMHDSRPMFFPEIGEVGEVVKLRTSLVDIRIQLAKYDEAKRMLSDIRASNRSIRATALEAILDLREATINVLQHKHPKAQLQLINVIEILGSTNQIYDYAEAHFQLAKSFQFSSKFNKAVEYYTRAEELYETQDNKFGLLNVYNNVGMIQHGQRKYDVALTYYLRQTNLAREVGDNRGISRGAYNASLVYRSKGNYKKAEKLNLEALEAFRQVDNDLGFATASQGLSGLYYEQKDYGKALYYGEQAVQIFLKIKEVGSLSRAYGVLGNVSKKLNNNEDFVFYITASMKLAEYLNNEKVPDWKKDYEISRVELDLLRSAIGISSFKRLELLAGSRLQNILKNLMIKLPNKTVSPDSNRRTAR